MSVRLYVKLPKAVIEKEGLEKMFTDFEQPFTSKIIKERKNGKCRGFGFITVSSDEVAEEFIAKYNDQQFVYEDEVFKEEDGTEFKLLIEKALPRTKPENKDKAENQSKPENKEKPQIADKSAEGKASRQGKSNKKGKSRNNSSKKATSVAESIQPDPRWAAQLNKLKDMFEKQTT